MKLVNRSQRDKYTIELEPGEFLDVMFDPKGVNSVQGSDNTEQALSIRCMTLPGGELALAISLNEEWLLKTIPSDHSRALFVIWQKRGVDQAKFIMNEECPRIGLVLKKVDLQKLLKEPDDD